MEGRAVAVRSRDEREPLEDGMLLARVSHGDRDAFAAIYDRYTAPAHALARRILGDEELARDVVQEVFLAVWRAPGRFDPGRGSVAGWLLGMAHHRAVDIVRREEAVRRRRDALAAVCEGEADPVGVDDRVWSSVRGERVRAALAQLTPVQRQALELAYFGGCTQREISELTGTPLGTVKTRMLVGMQRLRALLAAVSDSATVEGGGAS